MGIVRNLLVRVGVDLSDMQKQLKQAQKDFKTLGKDLGRIGEGLTKSITLPVVAIGAASLKMSADFEKSGNKLATIMDTNVVSMAEMKKGALNLSNTMGIAATEINEALYQTISATGDTENALQYTAIAAKAAKGGFTDTATAIDGLTTVMNAYGLKGSDSMAKVSDQMLTAQNYGKTTFGELASTIGNVIPVAASLNISTEELFASMATLTKNGINTASSVTGLKAAFSNIIRPSAQAAKKAAELGLDFNAARIKSIGWAEFLGEVSRATEGNTETMAQLFGSVEALNAVTVLATTGAEDFTGALVAMGDSAGATETAFETMNEGTAAGFERTKIKVQNLSIQLGEILAPAFELVLKAVEPMIDRLAELDTETLKNIIMVAGFLAILGPFILILSKVALAISGVIGWVSGLIGLFKLASAGSLTLKAVLTAVFGSIGFAVLAIIAIIAGLILIFKHLWDTNEEFRAAVIAIWENIKATMTPIIQAVWDFIVLVFTAISTFIQDNMGTIQEIIGTTWKIIQELFMIVLGHITGLITTALDLMKKGWEKWGNDIVAVLKWAWDLIQTIISAGLKIISGLLTIGLGILKGDWNMVWEGIKNTFAGIWGGIVGIVESAWSAITGIISKIIDGVKKAIDAVKNLLSAGNSTPATGLGTQALQAAGKIPKLANGGILTAPTLNIAGEAGPEAVIPLSKLDSMIGSGSKETVVQVILDGRVVQEYVDNGLGNKSLSFGGAY